MFGDRPRVTRQEWHEHVRPSLNNEGFSDHQLGRLEAMFEQSFQTNPARPDWKPGIDEATLDQTMEYMREHSSTVGFESSQLDKIDAILRKYISTRT